MPSTVVHAALALLLAAGLLGDEFDRRSLAVVAAATIFADLDAFTSLLVESTHRAAFHSLLVPLAAAAVVLWDTRLRERSWLRERWEARGVRIAWVALVGYVVAGIGLDLFHSAGVNLFYPLYDQFVAVTGRAGVTGDGFVQTFVDLSPPEQSGGVDVGQRGSTDDVHVGSGVDPSKGDEPETVRRRFPFVTRGWHLFVVVTSGITLYARARLEDHDGGAP